MAFLLDTNVLSESTKPSPAPEVLAWLADHSEQSFVSTISLGEIWKGIESLPDGRRRQKFENWMLVLEADYEAEFVVPDQSVMRRWGTLCARHEATGRKLSILDSILAATALVHDLTIVTRNTADFPPEVRTLNPWNP